MRTSASILPYCFMLLIFVSCSRASGPLTPSDIPAMSDVINPVIVAESDVQAQHGVVNNRGIFGAWKVKIDMENLTSQITPARNSVTREAMAIGDIFDADLSQFLTVSPCANCLSIPYVKLALDNNLLVGIRMKHPFANITARPDLHGFDVRAIFIADTSNGLIPGIDMMKPDGSIEEALINDEFLLNLDGYTSHYDEIVTDERYFMNGVADLANLNGFLRFFNAYGTDEFDPHNPAGHNVMPVGSGVSTREAVILHENIYTGLEFYIVADVAYGQSAVFSNRPDPQYYLPAFNRTEPWRIEYWIENNDLTYGDPSSTADIVIQVFDWQHGATVDATYPDPANLSGIRESSNVAQVEVSLGSLQDDVLISTTPVSGTGTPQDPLQYRLTVTNVNDNATYKHFGLIAVRDELYGNESPSGRVPIPETPAGFPYETLDIRDYAMYHPIWVNVPNDVMDRSYDNELNVVERSQYAEEGYAEVHADFFMDQSHKKFLYQWDYDYDGVTFDVDGVGLPQEYEMFTDGGKRDFGLRVRTNSKPPREYIYTIPVYVEGPPVQGYLEDGVWISSSKTRSSSIAMTDNHVYIATVTGSYTKWNIQLSIGDKSGNFTTHFVTGSSLVDYKDPSLLVIDDGINDGVYVAFGGNSGSGWGLYFNKGNLDGTGFSDANIKTLKAPGVNSYYGYPNLLTDSGNLYVYYYYAAPGVSKIYLAHSEDLGDTWAIEIDIDPPGITHGHPSAAKSSTYMGNAFYVAWHDRRNYTERGNDLYIAKSTDGINFEPSVNISTAIGMIHELDPSVATYGQQLAIAYHQKIDGFSTTYVYVKMMDLDMQSITDYEITPTSGKIHTKPAIGMAADGQFTLAYGLWDTTTEELTGIVETYSQGGAFGQYFRGSIVEENLGTVAWNGLEINPAVVCNRVAGGHAIENFAVWKTYALGQYESSSPETMIFGNVNSAYFISRGDMN